MCQFSSGVALALDHKVILTIWANRSRGIAAPEALVEAFMPVQAKTPESLVEASMPVDAKAESSGARHREGAAESI